MADKWASFVYVPVAVQLHDHAFAVVVNVISALSSMVKVLPREGNENNGCR